jgi:hypothetical protein
MPHLHPYRLVRRLPDGESLFWSPGLSASRLTQDAKIWQLGLEEGPLLPLLLRQGYLLEQPLELQAAPNFSADVRVWWEFDLAALGQARQAEQRVFHLWPGDGHSPGWALLEQPGGVCLACQVWRWIESLGAEEAAFAILRAGPPWPRWQPDWKQASEQLQRARSSGLSQVGDQSARPHSRSGCGCLRARPSGLEMPGLEWGPEWADYNPLGIITQISRDGPWWSCRSRLSQGSGYHPRAEIGWRKAVGETLERYCAWHVPPAASPHLPKLHWKGGKVSHWAQVRQLDNDKHWRCPAQVVSLANLPAETAGYDQLSHGLSCHPDRNTAVANARWEVIERDALAHWWLSVCENGQADCLQRDEQREVYRVPSWEGECVAVFRLDGGRRAAGAAAGPDCLARAEAEAEHNLAWLRRFAQSYQGLPASFSEHLSFYWHRSELFPKLRPGTSVRPTLRPKFYECDLTTPDVSALGYHVVKVFSPQMSYLPAQHQAWRDGRPALPHPFG